TVILEIIVYALIVVVLHRLDLRRALDPCDVVGIGPGAEDFGHARLSGLPGEAAYSCDLLGGLTRESFTALCIVRLGRLVLAVIDPIVHAGAIDLVVVLEQHRLLLRARPP